MTRPPELNGHDAVRALARALERSQRYIERLDARVAALATAVEELHATPQSDVNNGANPVSGPDTATGPAEPGSRSWLLADDPTQAMADLDDLVRWVWQVYLWFAGTRLTSCWLWHPAVIEELWCLRVAHAEAFHPETGSVLRVSDWHERLRPGAAARVEHEIRICELNRHVAYNGHPIEVEPPGRPALAGHAVDVATVWTAGAGLDAVRAAGPEPTAELLAEADAHQRSLYRPR